MYLPTYLCNEFDQLVTRVVQVLRKGHFTLSDLLFSGPVIHLQVDAKHPAAGNGVMASFLFRQE